MTAGSAPSYHVVPNAATNHLGGEDANGNAPGYLYDVENRIMGGGGYQYGYAPGNKRTMRTNCCTNEAGTGFNFPIATEEITFWSVTGQRMATYQLAPASYYGTATQRSATVTAGSNTITVASGGLSVGQVLQGPGIPANTTVTYINGSSVIMSANATASGSPATLTFLSTSLQLVATQSGTWYYFGGKLVKNKTGPVGADRLGSIGKYYPYGQEKPSATTNGTEKFATYFRDAETGLDYADQRYHSPGTGRFMTPDPYMASAGSKDPGSWNRFAYVQGDPINRFDPVGNDLVCVGPEDDLTCYDTPGPNAPQAGGGTTDNGQSDQPLRDDPGREQERKYRSRAALAGSRLPKARDLARQALSIDSCNSLLKGTGTLDPTAVLNGITSGKQYGTISFDTGVSALATTSGDLLSVRYSISGGGFYYTSVSITIQDSTEPGLPSDAWNLGSDLDRATILIHELAHALAFLQVGDVNGFGANDGNPLDPAQIAQQNKNQADIKTNCLDPLKKILGVP